METPTCFRCGGYLHWIEEIKKKDKLKGIFICYICDIFIPVFPDSPDHDKMYHKENPNDNLDTRER